MQFYLGMDKTDRYRIETVQIVAFGIVVFVFTLVLIFVCVFVFVLLAVNLYIHVLRLGLRRRSFCWLARIVAISKRDLRLFHLLPVYLY